MEIEIYPYKIEQRTEYSKIKIFNTETLEDISNVGQEFAKKIIEDYIMQSLHPENYFNIKDNKLIELKSQIMTEKLKYIFIPEGVKEIGKQACEGFNVEFINIPNTVKKIHDYAFFACENLEYIKLPDSISEVGIRIFERCRNLKSVRLSKNIKKIEKNMFAECISLDNVILPDSIDAINGYAFSWCASLKNIKCSKNLETILGGAFLGCIALEKIDLPDSLSSIGPSAFFKCVKLKSIEIPNNITSIAKNTFANCDNLESVKLSNKILYIKDEAFDNCQKLKELTLPDTVCHLGYDIVMSVQNLTNINVPRDLKSIDGNPFAYSSIKTLTFNYDLKRIDKPDYGIDCDLVGNSNIEKLIINNSVKKITSDAFNEFGSRIKEIDYLGTKEEFEEFKNNNKALFTLFTSLEKVNLIESLKDKTNEVFKAR